MAEASQTLADDLGRKEVAESKIMRDTSRKSESQAGSQHALLTITGLTKRYRGSDDRGIADVDLSVNKGEILAVLGPSGSGKSTLLKCIAGLERPDAGEIKIDDRVLSRAPGRTWVPPERRGVSVVFQSLALWPHLTVFDNVAYPLVTAKLPKKEIASRVMNILELVGCAQYVKSRPPDLSGGEQQRVACARALVADPPLVLFDEPFSSLDAALRSNLRRWLLELRDTTKMTALFVTHDQAEAFTLGDRVAVVLEGRLAEVGAPNDLYEQPRHSSVGKVLGAINFLPATVLSAGDDSASLELPMGALVARPPDGFPSKLRTGDKVVVGIRPGRVAIADEEGDPDLENVFAGKVEFARFTGVTSYYEVSIGGDDIVDVVSTRHGLQVGSSVSLTFPADRVRVFTDGTGETEGLLKKPQAGS